VNQSQNRYQQCVGFGAPALLAPRPGEARAARSSYSFACCLPRGAQRLFESDLALFVFILPQQHYAFDA